MTFATPIPCLHFPSKFEWSPSPLKHGWITADRPFCCPKNQVIPPRILRLPPPPTPKAINNDPSLNGKLTCNFIFFTPEKIDYHFTAWKVENRWLAKSVTIVCCKPISVQLSDSDRRTGVKSFKIHNCSLLIAWQCKPRIAVCVQLVILTLTWPILICEPEAHWFLNWRQRNL